LLGHKVLDELLVLLDLLRADPLHAELLEQDLPARIDADGREPLVGVVAHVGDVLERPGGLPRASAKARMMITTIRP
jgi:hypothetical protein